MSEKPPICQKCRKIVVRADAGYFSSISYWYCRTCKIEVDDFGQEAKAVKKEDFNRIMMSELDLAGEEIEWRESKRREEDEEDLFYIYPYTLD